MADGRHVGKYSKCHNSAVVTLRDSGAVYKCTDYYYYIIIINGPTETNLGGHITSCPRHVPHDSVAMATAVA